MHSDLHIWPGNSLCKTYNSDTYLTDHLRLIEYECEDTLRDRVVVESQNYIELI